MTIEVKIIDEKSGNPFRYFDNEEQEFLNFPRVYGDITQVKSVISGLLEKLGLQTNIKCLEVGAGNNSNPSQSLSQLGASVVTLDADWQSQRHTDISYNRFKRLKKNQEKA